MSGNVAVHYSSNRIDWETPQDLFDELHAIHDFEVDVCATAQNAKLPTFFTPEIDGLKQDWAPRVCWMNPPYGREIIHWMEKAYNESLNGAKVVCLVPSRTDTKWWHRFAVNGKIEFIQGRLRFVGAPSTAPFPSAIVTFNPAGYKGLMASITHQKRRQREQTKS